jgi:hypothetical protein
MLRNRQQPDGKDMTGSNMARMLAEMDQTKQMKSPYIMTTEDIERKGLQMRQKLETVVCEVEQMWNFAVMHDSQPSSTTNTKESVQSQPTQPMHISTSTQQPQKSPTDSIVMFNNKLISISDVISINSATAVSFIGCRSKEWTEIGQRLASVSGLSMLTA